MESGTLQIGRIRESLRTRRVGRRIEYFVSTTSTNDEAWRRIHEPDADGLVVLAEHQSAGRGRMGRAWESPRGASLLCSVAVVDGARELSGGDLSMLTAVAACDAIRVCAGVHATIKWPNDLLVDGRKVAGILIESRARQDGVPAYVIGIGVNCLQQRGHLSEGWGDAATSLELESDGVIDRTGLAMALLAELDRWLARPRAWTTDRLRTAWLALAEPMGQRVVLRSRGKLYAGSMIDIDPAAALVVQLDEGGIRAFAAADTTWMKRESLTAR